MHIQINRYANTYTERETDRKDRQADKETDIRTGTPPFHTNTINIFIIRNYIIVSCDPLCQCPLINCYD